MASARLMIPLYIAIPTCASAPSRSAVAISSDVAIPPATVTLAAPAAPEIPDLSGRVIYDANVSPGEDARSNAGRGSRKTIIQNLTVKLDNVKDGEGFAAELQRFVEQFDA